MGQYAEVEELRRRVLASREWTLGPDHPNTIGSVGVWLK